ncbi:MAG: hypothetical protein AAF549_06050 [Pseudomonadota bacterium]
MVLEPSGDGFLDYFSSGEVEGCATDAWAAIVNHAVNQSRREAAFNKRFIIKPDSVLTYACFNQDLQDISQFIDPIFSGSTFWESRDVDILDPDGPVTIQIYEESTAWENGFLFEYLTQDTLEESIVLVVDATWMNYRRGQFNHQILAGTTPGLGNGLMTCRNMAQIWQAAKCKNFDAPVAFPTFEQMSAGLEPREFPSGNGWDCN